MNFAKNFFLILYAYIHCIDKFFIVFMSGVQRLADNLPGEIPLRTPELSGDLLSEILFPVIYREFQLCDSDHIFSFALQQPASQPLDHAH